MPTLKALYQQVTRDAATHQRTIGAALDREPPRRRRLVRLYLQGLSDRAVGERTKRSYGAARALLRATMFSMWRRITNAPRYWRTGRATPAADARAARIRVASYIDDNPQFGQLHGPPRSLALEALRAAGKPGRRPPAP